MNNIKKIASALALGAIVSSSAQAQLTNTLYFHQHNYRTNALNPAMMPDGKFYIGFPGLSAIALAAGNNNISFSDVVKNVTKNGAEKAVFFLDESVNGQQEFLDQINGDEHVSAEVNCDLLNFGFRIKENNYLTFGVSLRADAHGFVPKEFFETALNGMPYSKVSYLNADKIGFSANAFAELALGYTRKVNDKLNIGAKLKFLSGVAGAKTDFSNLLMEGNIDEWNLSGNCDVYASFPNLLVENKDGHFDKFDTEGDLKVSDFLKSNGKGFGIDLGATYQLNDKIKLSASLADLGFIKYSSNLGHVRMVKDFHFDGGVYDLDSQELSFDEFEDSFEDAFIGDSEEKFSQYLTTKAYAGAEYALSNKISFGALSKTSFHLGHVWEDFIISANLHPCQAVSWTVAYNIFDHQWNGLSSALTLNLGPWNFFVAADNIPVSYAKLHTSDDWDGIKVPSKLQHIRVNVGMGFVFGQRPKKDKLPDEEDASEEAEEDFFDADGDGVMDSLDRCSDTPEGVEVDNKGCPLDADNDGVPDYLDKCADTPEGAQVDENGCPVDTDKDGVADYLDKCPDTPEGMPVTADGCPIDEDGDGVTDADDKCPGTPAGVEVSADGCPLDSDGDGVPDYLDKCPDVAGVKANNGCPEIKQEVRQLFRKALNGIQFQTGKATILRSSYPILDQIANTMKTNLDYILNISGHTDNVGNAALNLQLSKDRANSVMQYLVGKGVQADRLKADGYGDTQPVVPNTTSANRAKNRRVEFEVEFMATVPAE